MRTLSPATAKLFAPLSNGGALADTERVSLRIDATCSHFRADFFRIYKDRYTNFVEQHAPPSRESQQLLIRIPERKLLKHSVGTTSAWSLGATDYTVELLNHHWTSDRVVFEDVLTKSMYDYLLARSMWADKCAERFAEWKARHTVPTNNYTLHAANPLSPYQVVGLCNSLESDGFGLYMEQGTGKTPIGVAHICNAATAMWQAERRVYRAIVVCPNNVRENWVAEFNRFATAPGKVTVLRGNKLDRVHTLLDAFADDGESIYTVIVVGYDTLASAWAQISAVSKIGRNGLPDFDCAVADEAQYFKDPTTRRAKTMFALRDISASRYPMTGTPIGNSILDLYSLFEFMGKGYSGFVSYTEFKKFYGVYARMEAENTEAKQGLEILVSCGNIPYIQERLARYSFVVLKAEVLKDLPLKQYDIYEIELGQHQREIYNQLANDLYASIDKQMADDGLNRSLLVNNILTQLLRLSQITSGYICWDAEYDECGNPISSKRIEYFADNPKLQGMMALLDGKSKDEKSIVWTSRTPELRLIDAELSARGIKHVMYDGHTSDKLRKEYEYQFNNDPECTVFIGNSVAGGCGLNLVGYPIEQASTSTSNCSHVMIYSQGWSGIVRGQSIDRAHRRTTRVSLRVTDLVCPDTIDMRILQKVTEKESNAMSVSDLRTMLSMVLLKDRV